MTKELMAYYDARKSFYGKATYENSFVNDEEIITLFSYGHKILEINTVSRVVTFERNGLSITTKRHVREILRQNNFNESEVESILKNA